MTYEAPAAAARDSEYQSALKSVRSAIAKMKGCSEQEREHLQEDLDQLERMADKLEMGREKCPD